MFFAIILAIFAFAFYSYLKFHQKEIIEEEDDPLFKANQIYIRENQNKHRYEKKISIYYNNHNLKYWSSLKNFYAEGKGIIYSKEYSNIIIYEGNFKKGFPNGNGEK